MRVGPASVAAVEFLYATLLNGLAYGLLLFLLSSGLTLIFSLLGVVNFAHGSFYMLGAYVAWTLAGAAGFWAALLLAPLLVGLGGALFERHVLRRAHPHGHVAELLLTVGFGLVALEAVQLVWGRAALDFQLPAALQGPAWTWVRGEDGGARIVAGAASAGECAAAGASCLPFPASRAFMMGLALAALLVLQAAFARTRLGLLVRAALDKPAMLQALGHDVERVFTFVFAVGAALAALAGVLGGATFVTEPGMAAAVGPLVFVVVVVGGLGSLAGALLASLFIGLMQTAAVTFDASFAGLAQAWSLPVPEGWLAAGWARLGTAQVAPLLPYVLMILVLALRPRGLLGQRDS